MITLFENFTDDNYKKGDYVLLRDDDPEHRWNLEIECEIIEVFKDINYRIKSFYKKGTLTEGEESHIWVKPEEIERKLTPEEIERYKERLFAKKYNI